MTKTVHIDRPARRTVRSEAFGIYNRFSRNWQNMRVEMPPQNVSGTYRSTELFK